jgi:hypothetical protein
VGDERHLACLCHEACGGLYVREEIHYHRIYLPPDEG